MPVTASQAASQIAQERITETVSYPVTGDREVDAITGIMAILDSLEFSQGLVLGLSARVRVLQYLLRRMENALATAQQQQLQNMQYSQGAVHVGPPPASLAAGSSAAPWVTQPPGALQTAAEVNEFWNKVRQSGGYVPDPLPRPSAVDDWSKQLHEALSKSLPPQDHD